MDMYIKIREMWGKNDLSTVESLDLALENFRILFAYHSGKIENDVIEYHDTREIFENGRVTGYTGSTRTIFEQQNQKLCYDYLKNKIVMKEPITIQLILEIHNILTSGTYDERLFLINDERPGQFKKHDYIIGKNEVGYPPQEVERGLNELISEINDYSGSNILKAATYFHLRFQNIHPFADGNGRVGRTLMNYYLMINEEPPIIIFDEDKKEYYKALEAYDANEVIDPLLNFLKAQTVKTWIKTYERLQHS